MPAYHQMGHHSENLISEVGVDRYRGAILSPVNCDESRITSQIDRFDDAEGFETIFDPQLYFPNSERGKLPDWSYFPSDVDTADHSNIAWWRDINNRLIKTLGSVGPTACCSPTVVPRNFTSDYYLLNNDIFKDLRDTYDGNTIYTAIIDLNELELESKPHEISSVISSARPEDVYIVFKCDVMPRREISNTMALKGAMKLISLLEEADISVIVGFTSTDVILWKAAGASNCASGKFFNLRRFTPSRWDDPSGGGGQISYWTEESVLAYVRESDLIRLAQKDLISDTSLQNPFAEDIVDAINEGKPWLALSWRFYMHWFQEIERRLDQDPESALRILRKADRNWGDIESDSSFIFEERQNDGSWIRPWLRAVLEFQEPGSDNDKSLSLS